jgi:predicted metal-dependent hydrolase
MQGSLQVQMTDRNRLIELGCAALARSAWFEAHECWERAWRLSVVPDRPAVQALAQLAAALVHLSNGRRRGATSVLAKAHGKLMLPDTPGAVGTVDLTAVRSLIERLRDELAAGRTPDLGAVGLGRR